MRTQIKNIFTDFFTYIFIYYKCMVVSSSIQKNSRKTNLVNLFWSSIHINKQHYVHIFSKANNRKKYTCSLAENSRLKLQPILPVQKAT